MALIDRLTAPGPKRILALDGGGIRGALTLGYLERVEKILRDRHGDPHLRLCDYFDLIGGTSTGAIIAAGLAIGMEASEIKRVYLQIGSRIFGEKKLSAWQSIRALRRRQWRSLFDAAALEEELLAVFGDHPLGGETLRTGLCIVAKRADTRSTWVLFNHPKGRYFQANRDIPVRAAVRASTAAPLYFEPELIDVGKGERGAFVDGGVSLANNPALLLFLVATLKGYPFRWPTGEDKLFLLSVGTGSWTTVTPASQVYGYKFTSWFVEVPGMLLDDAGEQTQLLLQYLSNSPTARRIDREVGDLRDDLLTPTPALTYIRYNVDLEPEPLKTLGLADLAPKAVALRNMAAAANRFDLARIGEAAGAQQVLQDHFPKAFDLANPIDRTSDGGYKPGIQGGVS